MDRVVSGERVLVGQSVTFGYTFKLINININKYANNDHYSEVFFTYLLIKHE